MFSTAWWMWTNRERPCTGQLMSGWPLARKRLTSPPSCCDQQAMLLSNVHYVRLAAGHVCLSVPWSVQKVWEKNLGQMDWCTYKMTIEREEFNFFPPESGPLNATWSWKQRNLVTTVCWRFQLPLYIELYFGIWAYSEIQNLDRSNGIFSKGINQQNLNIFCLHGDKWIGVGTTGCISPFIIY